MSRLFTGLALGLTLAGVAAPGARAQAVNPALAQQLIGFTRPAFAPVVLPPEPKSPTFCTAEDKAAYAAALKAQQAIATASFAAARAYVEKLDTRFKELQTDPSKNAMAIDLIRTEMAAFDAPYMEIFRSRRSLTTRLEATEKAAVVACDGSAAQVAAPAPALAPAPVPKPAAAPVVAVAKPVPVIAPTAPPVIAAPPPQPVLATPAPAPALPVLQPAAKPAVVAAPISGPAPSPVVRPEPPRLVLTPTAPSARPAAPVVTPATPAPAPVVRPAPVYEVPRPLPALTDGEGLLPPRTVVWRTTGSNGQPLVVEVSMAPRWELGRQFVFNWSGKRSGAYGFKPISGDWVARSAEIEDKPDLMVSYIAVTLDTGQAVYLKRPDRVALSGLAVASSSRIFIPSGARVRKIQMVFGRDSEGVSAIWDFQ